MNNVTSTSILKNKIKIRLKKFRFRPFWSEKCQKGVAMATGWKTEGPGFEPRQLQTLFELLLPKNNK